VELWYGRSVDEAKAKFNARYTVEKLKEVIKIMYEKRCEDEQKEMRRADCESVCLRWMSLPKFTSLLDKPLKAEDVETDCTTVMATAVATAVGDDSDADLKPEGTKAEVEEESAEAEINVVSVELLGKVEGFAEKHGLDERARQKLSEAPDEVAKQILAKGLKSNVKNPSAYVSKLVATKVKKAQGDYSEQYTDESQYGEQQAEGGHNDYGEQHGAEVEYGESHGEGQQDDYDEQHGAEVEYGEPHGEWQQDDHGEHQGDYGEQHGAEVEYGEPHGEWHQDDHGEQQGDYGEQHGAEFEFGEPHGEWQDDYGEHHGSEVQYDEDWRE
jgi:hypothetical protein